MYALRIQIVGFHDKHAIIGPSLFFRFLSVSKTGFVKLLVFYTILEKKIFGPVIQTFLLA